MTGGSAFLHEFIRNVKRFGTYDALADGLSIQDTDFRILYQNNVQKSLLGDHAGEYCYTAFARRDRVCDKCPLVTVFNRKAETATGEVVLPSDKGEMYFSISASAVKDRAGRIRAGIYALRDMTEQRHEDQQRRESEEKYSAIFRNAVEAIYLIDPSTLKIVDCNQKASELSGHSPRVLRGMNFRDVHPDEEQDIVERIFDKAAQMGTLTGVCGISQVRGNKSRVPVELNLTTLKINGKNYVLCYARDISKQRETEEKLRLEHERLINIFDSAEDGIYIVNRQYVIEYLNPAFRREFGPLKGRKCYEYFSNRKSVCRWCNIEKVFSGESSRCEWYSPRNRKIYDLIETPIKNPDGSISKLSVLRDITEKKKVEEALRESEDRFRSIFEVSPLGIVLYSAEEKPAEVNPAFRNMLGYGAEDMKTGFLYMTHPDDIKVNLKLFSEMVEGQRDNYQIETRCYRKDGSLMWGKMYANAIRDRTGSFKYAISIIEDITDRRVMEERLRSATGARDILFSGSARPERRAHRRYRAVKDCWATVDNSENVNIKDISFGGICLTIPYRIETDSFHEVKVFPSMNGDIQAKASVVRASQDARGLFETGMQFVETDQEFMRSIERFISMIAV